MYEKKNLGFDHVEKKSQPMYEKKRPFFPASLHSA